MARATLYADESHQVERKSSINQYGGFFSVKCQGGWTPILFDQLDGINCQTVNSHPVVLSLTDDDIGYHYADAKCSYASEKFLYFDKYGVEQVPLPNCVGGSGEMYERFINEYSFINFDRNSLGLYNRKTLRVGLDYVQAKDTLPAVD